MLIIPAAREEVEEQEAKAKERRRLRREKYERQKRERSGEVDRRSTAANRKGFMPNATQR